MRPKTDLKEVIDTINNEHITDKVLIEIKNINELSQELLDTIPDNVSIRIHDYNMNYYNTFKSPFSTYNNLKNVTYNVSELKQIMTEINIIKSGINENWTDYQKAEYVYEYLRDNII